MAITTGKYFYCSHVTPKNHDMNLLLVNQITSKMQLQKLPGSYLINSFWYKTVLLPQETNRALPTYIQRQLSTSIVVNISENIQKQNLHRPIACLNFMYKIYTSCLNLFLYDHCHCHKIIATEQAAGKEEYGDAQNTCWSTNQLCQKWETKRETSQQYGLIIKKLLTLFHMNGS